MLPFADALWCRIAIQAYNDAAQCAPVADALEAAIGALG
jgi:hypothetical protein